jgi:hypothetical protein
VLFATDQVFWLVVVHNMDDVELVTSGLHQQACLPQGPTGSCREICRCEYLHLDLRTKAFLSIYLKRCAQSDQHSRKSIFDPYQTLSFAVLVFFVLVSDLSDSLDHLHRGCKQKEGETARVLSAVSRPKFLLNNL